MIKNNFYFVPPLLPHLNYHIYFLNIGQNYLFRHIPSYSIDEERIRKSFRNALIINLFSFFSALILLTLQMSTSTICKLFYYCHTIVRIFGTLKNLYLMLNLKIYSSNPEVLISIYLCVLTTFLLALYKSIQFKDIIKKFESSFIFINCI